ncbi:acidic phospholipase A2 PA4 [Patella vulgata]|uniref:acidic phospholipase A2 PA4 n=1 Tax=Patella vulgata TaxID=6465 RepID=UPI00218061AF|nr:acidic phospholipase A2 PA4 [Patella vulgata]
MKVVFGRVEFYSDTKRAVEKDFYNGEESCYIHGDRSYLLEIFLNKDIDVKIIGSGEMESILHACHLQNMNTSAESHAQAVIRKKRAFTFPGTKWCGAGSTATNYDDLGEHVETDKCCREHDHCQISIPPLTRKYGLYNTAFWYSNHCSCDDTMYDCLKNANEESAASVGKMYFNVLGIDCIEETGETFQKCVQGGWWWRKCDKYETVVQMRWRDPTEF